MNNIVINYANTHFEGNTQKQYAESFITLGVSAKLLTFLPIVSGNKYQLNLNSFEYKTLKQIIAKRNKIAHGKDFYKDAEPASSEDSSFSIDLERLERDHFLFLNKNECDRYFKALHSFVENVYNILERDKLNGTDLIIPIIKKRSK